MVIHPSLHLTAVYLYISPMPYVSAIDRLSLQGVLLEIEFFDWWYIDDELQRKKGVQLLRIKRWWRWDQKKRELWIRFIFACSTPAQLFSLMRPLVRSGFLLFPLLNTSSPLPFCSITTNHTSCWFLFCATVFYNFFLSFSLSLRPALCCIYQGMRPLVWCLWGPYTRLHGSNRRMRALSCRTPPCRPLSRASLVRPDHSASKS